jgi:hypothetical protein
MRRLRRRAAARGTRHGRSDNSRIGHFLLQPLPLRVDSSDVEMRDQPLNPHPAAEPAREPSAGVESPADRRRSPRATYRVVFNIYPLPGGAGAQAGGAVEVVLQDLSLVGMGIIHSTALQMGQQYQIPLVRGDEPAVAGQPQALLATVVRCEQLDDGLFSIGFEFNSSVDAVDQGSRQLTGQPAPREWPDE